jgi:uncharacterized protein RhaS with RHS repeats
LSKPAQVAENREFRGNSRTTHLGPFGELIRATGPMAKLNPFRFSTKYQDDETDFLYYGYRYYNPSTGPTVMTTMKMPLAIPTASFGMIRWILWTTLACFWLPLTALAPRNG